MVAAILASVRLPAPLVYQTCLLISLCHPVLVRAIAVVEPLVRMAVHLALNFPVGAGMVLIYPLIFLPLGLELLPVSEPARAEVCSPSGRGAWNSDLVKPGLKVLAVASEAAVLWSSLQAVSPAQVVSTDRMAAAPESLGL